MADLINATVSDEDANSYLTIEEADDLVDALPGADAWDELEDDARTAILIQGTRLIDAFRPWGTRKVKAQRLAFPRGQDKTGVIPEGVKLALAAFADFMASLDLAPLKALQGEGVTNSSILGQTMTFEKDSSGLPAAAREELKKVHGGTTGWGAHHRDGDCTLFG